MAALERVGLAPERMTEIVGGWANWTFELDGSLIVRFPRNDSVALATHRELNLLPALARHVSFAVPEPTHVGTWNDRPFFAYRRIDGRALRAGDDPAPVGRMVAELHAFPVERAAELLRVGPPSRAWRDRYVDFWPLVEEVALPEMDAALADEVRRRYHAMVDDPPDFPPTLVHNDLGPEHVLVGAGIIDFEDATVGDPAVDIAPLVATLGRDALPVLTAGRDLGDRLEDRIRFYRWMGSVHAVIYGVTAGVEEERLGGLAELPRRLEL